MNKLGCYGSDVITGFSGLATAYAQYLTGCNQYLLQPKGVDKDGKPLEPFWHDEQRISWNNNYDPIKLDNKKSPGCDTKSAPKR